MGWQVYTWRTVPETSREHANVRPMWRFEQVEFSEIHPRIGERRICEHGPQNRQEWRLLREKFARVG